MPRTKIIRLVVSDDEHQTLLEAANQAGHPLAAWARAELLRLAKRK